MIDLRLDFERVAVLARDHREVRWLAGHLLDRGQLAVLVLEQRRRSDTAALWLRRAQRNGTWATASSGLALLVDRFVTVRLERGAGPLEDRNDVPAHRVNNINVPQVRRLVNEAQPTLGLILGTRILNPELIASFGDAPLLNLHSGLTPSYRGTHGGAWAILDGHPDRVASTWHIVDRGIDTGRPVVHVPVSPRPTLALLAREHREAGVGYMNGLAQQRAVQVRLPPVPARGGLLYPPGLRDWRRFRRLVSTTAPPKQ